LSLWGAWLSASAAGPPARRRGGCSRVAPPPLFFILPGATPTAPLFPSTTLFRSNRCALALAISALHCRSGVMSSKIQNERPCVRSEEHTSELQSRFDLVCRLLLEKKKTRPSTGGPGRSPTSRLRPTSHRSRRALL